MVVSTKNPHNAPPQPSTPEKVVNDFTMLILGVMVGIIAGFGAIVFRLMIAFFHNLFFYGRFDLYYDANIHAMPSTWGLGIILVPVLGALLVTWLVKNYAPEARGHGVPEVIDAVYYKRGIIRPMVALIKALASSISIGSGGSVGREGPIVQIGSAFGATLGQWITMPVRQRVVLIAAGAGAGIAATFNAPIGGIAFAMELLLVSINARTMMVVMVSTITAAYIGRYFLGVAPAFNIPLLAIPHYHIQGFSELIFFIPLGILVGMASSLFIHSIYWFEDRFEQGILNPYVRHTVGMLLLGFMLYGFMYFSGHYYVQGVGYGTIVDILKNVLTNPWFLLLLFFAKLLATGLTLGSGASGGVFSPALFLGATLGGAYGGWVTNLLPGLHTSPVVFAVAAMAGMISGTTGAIITAITMLFEMTRDYNAIIPIVLTVAISYGTRILLSKESIYTLKLIRRGRAIHEGMQAALSSGQLASHVMNQNFFSVSLETLRHQPELLQRDSHETPITLVIEHDAIKGVISAGQTTGNLAAAFIDDQFIFVADDTPLLDAMRQMNAANARILIVSERPNNRSQDGILGVITQAELAQISLDAAELLT